MDFKENRSRFACSHHVAAVCLENVAEALEFDNLLEAEIWLKLADYAFKETIFWVEKQKPYPKWSNVEEMDKKDMADLLGHLEGARVVVQERTEK